VALQQRLNLYWNLKYIDVRSPMLLRSRYNFCGALQWPDAGSRSWSCFTIANGFPVIGGKLFDTQFSQPLDRGVVFVDGRPVFGQSKTIRGVILSLLATAASAPVLPIWAPRIAEKL
jgi:hypothetical protein